MNYEELSQAARGKMGQWCRACPVCDGRACGTHMPGPGAKGDVAERNHSAWDQLHVNMDTLHEPFDASTEVELFGRKLALPVMVGPLGDVNRHYGPLYDTVSYNSTVLQGCASSGTLGWTGDGLDASIMTKACDLIGQLDGQGIPTVKPWASEVCQTRMDEAIAAHPVAIAMDVDAAGLPFLKGQVPPAGFKSVQQLAEIRQMCAGTPFIVKGVMTLRGAQKALEAGATGIVVSNHGGRVQAGVPATAEVLGPIAREFGSEMTILVDGGIRSGLDVFRAIALGADAVLMCRPFVVATYGGGQQGVQDYLAQLQAELADTMCMCGTRTLDDISADCLA